MKNKYIILIIIIFLSLIGCKKIDNEPLENIEPPILEDTSLDETIQEEDKIKTKLDSMTLEEKIGQLLIVGFEGTDMSNSINEYIEEIEVGGLVFFSRNIDSSDQVKALVKKMNSISNIPLFLAIDEEGGQVSRLPKEFKRLPNSIDIGKTLNQDLAFEYGKLLGDRVRSIGLNLNFAPVMDINSNPNNPVIGKRAFGITPETVSKIGVQVLKGMQSTSVIPSVKHFPGHGDTAVDSHLELPIIEKSVEDIKKFELLPFEAAIKENVDMVMIGHILIPSLDKDYPATLSKKIIEGLLRDGLQYDSVVISDDMTMGAILNSYSLEIASKDFLKAGGDIILVCHGEQNPKLVFDYLVETTKNGGFTIDEIDQKVYRVLKLKEKYLNGENIELNIEDINERVKLLF